MIVRSSDLSKKINPNMRDGKGEVIIEHIVLGENLPPNTRLVSKITLNPGCSIGMHEHIDETELYYILEGELVSSDNGEEVVLFPGDSLFTGHSQKHFIENKTDKPGSFLAIISTK